jgi:tRNA threonylcarbamoyladenosine biosynthesis protein TsaB
MNLLAFDTCLGACSAAIRSRGPDGILRLATRFETMTKGHAEALFPMIDAVMAEADARYADLDAIAVTVGPGTFTGTRVGIAAARGLLLATGLPVYGTTSLAAIAGRALRQRGVGQLAPDAPILVCHDARRGQLYVQKFADLRAQPASPPTIQDIETAAADALRCGIRWVAGSGAGAVIAAAKTITGDGIAAGLQEVAGTADGLPDAESLLEVALERLDPPATLYLRPPDAKPQTGEAIPRVS